mmetsp:Transcript_123356/g.334968  ORF Transcript_123356/g.334968 Transcript_123356/m.334968 type:complete len:644 (+) Transcript_123356:1098-3029(+)
MLHCVKVAHLRRPLPRAASGVEGSRAHAQHEVRQEGQLKSHHPHAHGHARALVAPVETDGLEERSAHQHDAQHRSQAEKEPAQLGVAPHVVEAVKDRSHHGSDHASDDGEQYLRLLVVLVGAVADDPGEPVDHERLQQGGADPEQNDAQLLHLLSGVVVGGVVVVAVPQQESINHQARGQRRAIARLHRVRHLLEELAREDQELREQQGQQGSGQTNGDPHQHAPRGVAAHAASLERRRVVAELPGHRQRSDAERHHEVPDRHVLDGVEAASLVLVRLAELHAEVRRRLRLAGLAVNVLLERTQLAGEVVLVVHLRLHQGLLADGHVVHLRRDETELDHVCEHEAAGAEVQERLEAGRAEQHGRHHGASDVLAREQQGASGAGEAAAQQRGELLLRARNQPLPERQREDGGDGTHGRGGAASDEADEEVEAEAEHQPAGPGLLAPDHRQHTAADGLEASEASRDAVERRREEEEREAHGRQHACAGLLPLGRQGEVAAKFRAQLAAALHRDELVAAAEELVAVEDHRHRLVAASRRPGQLANRRPVLERFHVQDREALRPHQALQDGPGAGAERAPRLCDEDHLPLGPRVPEERRSFRADAFLHLRTAGGRHGTSADKKAVTGAGSGLNEWCWCQAGAGARTT